MYLATSPCYDNKLILNDNEYQFLDKMTRNTDIKQHNAQFSERMKAEAVHIPLTNAHVHH